MDHSTVVTAVERPRPVAVPPQLKQTIDVPRGAIGANGAADQGAILDSDSEDDAIRLTAYFLWEQDGRPEGRVQEYWLRARERHARQDECDGQLEENWPDDGRQSGSSDPT